MGVHSSQQINADGAICGLLSASNDISSSSAVSNSVGTLGIGVELGI
jgi:hypothetical protein